MALDDDIKAQYPSLYFLLNDPEVGNLLREAVNPDVGFSPGTFQSKLYETGWFKGRSASQREAEILRNTDPGEYAERGSDMQLMLRNMNFGMGFGLNMDEYAYIADAALGRGDKPGDVTFNQRMAEFLQADKSRITPTGQIGGIAAQVSQMAQQEYLVDFGQDAANGWGINLAFGIGDEKGLRNHLAMLAASAYPHLAQRIAAGETMGDITAPYREILSEYLDIPLAQVNMMDPKWRPLFDIQIGANSVRRAMTMSEATLYVKSQPEYWGTNKGKAEGAQMATFLSRTFGLSA